MDPVLLRHRSGRTAALVLVLGFGGATMVLGAATVIAGAAAGGPVLGGLLGYGAATLPFLLLAAIVAPCRSELWFVPADRAFRLLTFRPWLRQPRAEQAPLEEYAGVRIDPPSDGEGGPVVSLIAAGGDVVPLRQFAEADEATAFASNLAEATGLWLRGEAREGATA